MIRYHLNDEINDLYYPLPKALFAPPYNVLTNNARMVYAVFLNRTKASQWNTLHPSGKNGKKRWANDDDEIYFIYTQPELAELFGCSVSTISRAMNELVKVGLLEIVRRGSMACYLYLGVPVTYESASQTCSSESHDPANVQVRLAPMKTSKTKRVNKASETIEGGTPWKQGTKPDGKKSYNKTALSAKRQSTIENALKRYEGVYYEQHMEH